MKSAISADQWQTKLETGQFPFLGFVMIARLPDQPKLMSSEWPWILNSNLGLCFSRFNNYLAISMHFCYLTQISFLFVFNCRWSNFSLWHHRCNSSSVKLHGFGSFSFFRALPVFYDFAELSWISLDLSSAVGANRVSCRGWPTQVLISRSQSRTTSTSSTSPASCRSTSSSQRTATWRRRSSWPPGRTSRPRTKSSSPSRTSNAMPVRSSRSGWICHDWESSCLASFFAHTMFI